MTMLLTAKIGMDDTLTEREIADFLTYAAFAVYSTHHTVLKTSPGAATLGQDVVFDIPLLADWSKIGKHR